MALGSTQGLTEMSTRDIPLGVGLTTLPHSCAVCPEILSCPVLEPSGPVQACTGTALPLPQYLRSANHEVSH